MVMYQMSDRAGNRIQKSQIKVSLFVTNRGGKPQRADEGASVSLQGKSLPDKEQYFTIQCKSLISKPTDALRNDYLRLPQYLHVFCLHVPSSLARH